MSHAPDGIDATAQIINETGTTRYGKVKAYAVTVNGTRTLRLSAHSIAAGKIVFEQAIGKLPHYFAVSYDAPTHYEIRVRNTADRSIDHASGGYHDDRTGNIIVPCESDSVRDQRVAAEYAYRARIAHLNADYSGAQAKTPGWARELATATTETDAGQTITRYTGWRAVLDPTYLNRYPKTCDKWELNIVADDQAHDCAGLGCASVHGSPCDSNAAVLCGMTVEDGDRADIIDAAITALAEQGFRIVGPWTSGPDGTLIAPLALNTVDSGSAGTGPEISAPASAGRPVMRFCRCGVAANRVFTPLDPQNGEPDEAATFFRCNIHAYDPDVPQKNIRQRQICWRGVQFGREPRCLELIEEVASGEGVIGGWYHVDRRITRDHHAVRRV